MKTIPYIPKGSELWSEGKKIAVTLKDFVDDYVPQGTDYEPELKPGAKYDRTVFKWKGKIIYIYPDGFVRSTAPTIKAEI